MRDAYEARWAVVPGMLLAVLSLLVGAAQAGAQESPGPRGTWLAWAGCWEGTGEPLDAEAGEAMLCVRPGAGARQAELLTVVDGEIRNTETLRADGARHPVSRQGCRGWESARFSGDGARVYLRSELTCEGGVRRVSSGIMALVSPYEWLDVQTVEVGDEANAWVQRYGLADPARAEEVGLAEIAGDRELAVESARMVAARAPGIDDVIEASAEVHPEAVKAWVAEQNDPFRVDADALLAMSDAGVPDDVVDVVVAVSYPERFAVDGEPRKRDDDYRRRDGDYGGYGRYDHPRKRVRVGVHFGYPHYYGPYGYRSSFFRPYGFHGGFGFYRYRPSVVIVRPADRGGRVIEGRGYTRRVRGGSGASSSGASSPAPSTDVRKGSSSGGSVSPLGASSGGRSTGRKAKPRKCCEGDGGGGGPFD